MCSQTDKLKQNGESPTCTIIFKKLLFYENLLFRGDLYDIELSNDMCNNIFWNVKLGQANIDGDIHSRVFNLIGILIVLPAKPFIHPRMFAMYYPPSAHLNLYRPKYCFKENTFATLCTIVFVTVPYSSLKKNHVSTEFMLLW